MKGLVAAVSFVLLVSASVAFAEGSVGTTIQNFTLSDHLGTQYSLDEWATKKAVVVVFLGTECPLTKLYAARLVELAERYKDQPVQIVGVNANGQDTLLEIGHYARVHKLDFPLLKDAGNNVADRFGATRTPEAFLLDENSVVRYQGRIDDQYGVGYSRASFNRQDLVVAIDELLSDKQVSEPYIDAVGCLIGRASRRKPTGDVTYSRGSVVQHGRGICPRGSRRCTSGRPGTFRTGGLNVRWGDQSWDEMMLGTFVTSLGPNVRRGEFPRVTLVDGEFSVSFRYRGDENTRTVSVAGSFNDWNKDRHPMHGPDNNGLFTADILMKKGQHEYKFVINGDQWTHDPENPNRTGPFNNTVVRVRDNINKVHSK